MTNEILLTRDEWERVVADEQRQLREAAKARGDLGLSVFVAGHHIDGLPPAQLESLIDTKLQQTKASILRMIEERREWLSTANERLGERG